MGPVAAVAIPAAIQAGGQVAGAITGGKGASKAADKQLQANREALAWEKEKEARRRADYEKGLAIWAAGRKALAARYGIDLGDALPSASFGASPTAAVMPQQQGGTIQDLIAQRAELQQGGQEMPDIGTWSQWKRYGLG